jgi:hypothetical protein
MEKSTFRSTAGQRCLRNSPTSPAFSASSTFTNSIPTPTTTSSWKREIGVIGVIGGIGGIRDMAKMKDQANVIDTVVKKINEELESSPL